MARETSWRMFAGEINSSTIDKKGTDEKAPAYVITPLGTMVNRVLVAGILTELENTGTEEEPMWKGKIEDVSGNFFFSAGKFQPEASASLADLETGSFVAAVSKVRTFSTNDGRIFVSLRPERIMEIDEEKRRQWILEAATSMWNRLVRLKEACKIEDMEESDLINKGFTKTEAEGIMIALDCYGLPDSTKYLKILQNSLRRLLPDQDVDFGLPGDSSGIPDEIDDEPSKPSKGSSEGSADKEEIIMAIINELDVDPRGVPYDEVISRAAMQGISAEEAESACDSLMDKGNLYEPNLGYLKSI